MLFKPTWLNPNLSFPISGKHAYDSLITFFTAGSDTLGSTLCYLMLYLNKNPQVCIKCQEELDRVVGDREPRFEDRPM